MLAGEWLHDPTNPDLHKIIAGGYPSGILDSDLMRLIRRGLCLDPQARPAPQEWLPALHYAFEHTCICPYCNNPFISDISKTRCPYDGKLFPHLISKLENGSVIALDTGAALIGRDNLGGSAKVSQKHAIFRRIGPETYIEPMGRNGTFRFARDKWVRLPDHQRIPVQNHDKLRFADVCGKLIIKS